MQEGSRSRARNEKKTRASNGKQVNINRLRVAVNRKAQVNNNSSVSPEPKLPERKKSEERHKSKEIQRKGFDRGHWAEKEEKLELVVKVIPEQIAKT